MLTNLDLRKILFLDIETVPLYESFALVPEIEQTYFGEKTAYQRKEDQTPEEFYEKAGIWAEFGKIICIGTGGSETFIDNIDHPLEFRKKFLEYTDKNPQ